MIDGRFLLFSKTIRDNEDSVSIQISCDRPLGVSISTPKSIITYEVMNGSVPVVVVGLSDAVGDSINLANLDTNAVYTLDISSNKEKVIADVKLRLVSVESGNTIAGQSRGVGIELHFVHASWKEFAYKIHNRGWGEIRYSDLVEQIMDMDQENITPTKGINAVTQPYWTNKQLLQWLIQRCVSTSNELDYVYSISLEGNFFFTPFVRLASLRPVKRFATSTPPENRQVGHILHYTVKERSSKLQKQGSGGVVNSYYDFNSGEYHNDAVVYDGSFGATYSDYTSINEDLAIAPLVLRHGRDSSEAINSSKNRIAHIVDSSERLTVMTYASLDTRVGDVIEVLIKTSRDEEESQGMYSEAYSGKYVVGAIKHIVQDNGRQIVMQSELTLLRQGINDSEVRQYVAGGNRV